MATVTSSEYVLFQVLPQPILNFLCMMMIRKSLGTRNCHDSLVLWSKRLHRMEGRPAPIQNGSLIGQLARTIEIFHGKIVMYPLVTISHPNETQFHSLVRPSNFLDPLRQFIILCAYLPCHQNRCCASLMYEVKSTSESPPSTTAIAASNRKDRLYRVFRVYRLYRLYRLYKVYRVYRERLL